MFESWLLFCFVCWCYLQKQRNIQLELLPVDQWLFSCSRSSKILGEDPQLVKKHHTQLTSTKKWSLHHVRICSMAYSLSVLSSVDFALASVQRLQPYSSQHGSIGWGDKYTDRFLVHVVDVFLLNRTSHFVGKHNSTLCTFIIDYLGTVYLYTKITRTWSLLSFSSTN